MNKKPQSLWDIRQQLRHISLHAHAQADASYSYQGGKRPGGETGSPFLGQCVMRRRTGTSAPSALPVKLMAAKNLLLTNRKWHFFLYFEATTNDFWKGFFDIFGPELNTILSVGTSLMHFRRKLLKFEWNKTVSNAGMSQIGRASCRERV